MLAPSHPSHFGGRTHPTSISIITSSDTDSSDWMDKRYQIHAGYPGIQTSRNAMSGAPFWLASSMREMAFAVEASRSSQADSAWMTATADLY